MKKSDHIVQVNLVNFGADAMRAEISKDAPIVCAKKFGMGNDAQPFLHVCFATWDHLISLFCDVKSVKLSNCRPSGCMILTEVFRVGGVVTLPLYPNSWKHQKTTMGPDRYDPTEFHYNDDNDMSYSTISLSLPRLYMTMSYNVLPYDKLVVTIPKL